MKITPSVQPDQPPKRYDTRTVAREDQHTFRVRVVFERTYLGWVCLAMSDIVLFVECLRMLVAQFLSFS
jgi:hypothetical protein